jgi:hypothetical protein
MVGGVEQTMELQSSVMLSESAEVVESHNIMPPNQLAPVPLTVADTGLDELFLVDLLAKHLYAAGDLDQHQLAHRSGLSWRVTESLLALMREGAYLELRRGIHDEMRYGLTDKGKNLALEALVKSAYTGPAPVTLEHYTATVRAQSVSRIPVTYQTMVEGYSDVVVSDAMLRQLGAAIISGRSMMLYGEPGSGKTYLAQRIVRVVAGDVLVPYAITVGGKIIKIFDPVIHQTVQPSEIDENESDSLMLTDQHDPRYVLCHRPAAVTGGELTIDMLELSYDTSNKVYDAPSQLKANNGVFIIDDLGRQRVRPIDLLNRWIIPMEEKRDFLTVGGGTRFEVPTDIVMVFSTNLNPLDLANEAFLRRLGYKIKFGEMTIAEYEQVWRQVCNDKGVAFDQAHFDFLINELYAPSKKLLMPCHPRDLIGLVVDQCRFNGDKVAISTERLECAWKTYFVEEL